MEEENMVIVPVSDTSNKKKNIIITVILVAVILFLTVGAVLIYRLYVMNPIKRLAKGFANMSAEICSYSDFLSEDIDFEAIKKGMEEKSVSMDMSMNVTIDDQDTIGIDYHTNYHYPNKEMDAEFAISAYNIDFIRGNIAAKDNCLYVTFPDILKDTYYVKTDTLGKDFNASYWSEGLGSSLPEDLGFELFPDLNVLSMEEDKAKLKLADDYQQLLETMEVENSKTTISIYRAGESVQCAGVRVTLKAEQINVLLEDLISEYQIPSSEMRVEEDAVLLIYLDKKDRIVSIMTENDVKLSDSDIKEIGAAFTFSGSDKTLDDVAGEMHFETEDDNVTMKVSREAYVLGDSYEDKISISMGVDGTEYYMDMGYYNKWDMVHKEFAARVFYNDSFTLYDCNVRGDVVYTDSDNSISLNIGKAEILEDGKSLGRMYGHFTVKPFEGTVSIPEKGRKILDLDEDEAGELFDELFTSFLMTFSGL